ncbi:hypothetical protein OPV22_026031 [Ensete ventricosum]|uniref:FAF domain-containing protein n=1 Tax=Ensete ventricosum TaxID=4639 RepID=A0A427A7N7_ENSVE|nr:hypothetical protein OPV22_026031 [Ensete ventricosum]RRT72255.1 hypothetical protein B296_00028753 [Ensete ventricosum]RWW32652.1 hypothetical protein GW17_00002673 [Ensete ventricosum]RWW60089.1 hypothetical protein BHE74_00032936 [Ensete ventricosum]RZR85444.1 hypothetical protein BHM03_00012423 [Ensete ventricosum]
MKAPSPLGLKTIADASLDRPRESNCVNRSFVASSRSPCLPPPSSAEDDKAMDLGQDGGDDAEEDVVEDDDGACWATYGRRRPGRRFPPPIPLLARTGKLTCRLPWVLKRTYEDDGRLVIQEVRVKHHEYFRACRRDGRLTLQLVELADHQPKEEEIPVDTDKKQDTSSSLSSSSSSSEEEKWIQRMAASDKAGATTPRLPLSSKMVLSSSMPEPMCGKASFEKGGPTPPLHLQLAMSRMRLVHG